MDQVNKAEIDQTQREDNLKKKNRNERAGKVHQ
jgi:hypothetical protein